MHSPEDIRALRRDKYGDNTGADITADLARLAVGEPLAYVIGWIPFLGLRVYLDSHPLIPRPETEWWTEKLIAHLREKYKNRLFTLLDLCAGSGAIGLAVMRALPNACVTFAEIVPEYVGLIYKNLELNGFDGTDASVREGDLFKAVGNDAFDIIATNPPYIPDNRILPESVAGFEPSEALFAGFDGLSIIKRIAKEAPDHLDEGGELWLECDSEHAEAVRGLFETSAKAAELHTDQYGRPRLLVSYW